MPGDARIAARRAVLIHHMVKGYGVFLRTLAQLAGLDPRTADPGVIDEAHKVISMCLKPWLKVSRKFITHPQDELHGHTLAFLVLLALDAGLPVKEEGESAISVAITFEGDDEPTLL
jgi:hypothetical protein